MHQLTSQRHKRIKALRLPGVFCSQQTALFSCCYLVSSLMTTNGINRAIFFRSRPERLVGPVLLRSGGSYSRLVR